MGWGHYKKKTAATMDWQQETCKTADVAARIAGIAKARWVVKHIFWAGVPGELVIVKMQSSDFAPKVKKAKAAKKAQPAPAEDDAVTECTTSLI